MRVGKAKTDKSFSGAGYARQEADDMLVGRSRLINVGLDGLSYQTDFVFRGFALRDLPDGQTALQSNGGLNDARNWVIRAFVPEF